MAKVQDPVTRRVFSIVVPVYQNEANLSDTVPRLLALQDQLPKYRLELILVDDGSKDRSLGIAIEMAKQYPGHLRVVKLTRNFGQTPAIQAGLRYATGDCVGVISADLQEPHELFVEMVAAWEQGARFVLGERQERTESSFHQMVSGTYWLLVRRLAFPDFPKMGYDFCLLDRQVVSDINRINEKNSSIFVLIYWLGYTPVRLPITRNLRRAGRSQWRLSKKISFTIDTLIGFTYLPARGITILSVVLAVASLVYLAYSLVNWLLFRATPPGWMTQVGLTTLLGSMIAFSLGIVSEYLVRILDEARKRPPFVVDRTIGDDDHNAEHQ
ncbi:MAG: glycosyltransferase family 2 protein [Candidatus Latescibacteria bacterium]|nr:glycosyltransferase family 2 protein [Candidatus Latescibacterota bacterium]